MTPQKVAILCTLCLAIGGGAGALFSGQYRYAPPVNDTNIAFPIKVYTDTGSFVSITGRLAGNGIGYRNNVETITCYKKSNECQLQDVEQIGANLISSLQPSTSIPITHWDAEVITASDGDPPDPFSCSKITINIARKRQFALWVQEPTNQASLNCQHADAKTYKWTIERSLWEENALPKQ